MGTILKGGHWKINKKQLKTWLPTAYYYFFYGALGSLFPFLNLYYRAVGMDPWQIGILAGIRPLIALLFAPIWSFVANKFKLRKAILIVSLISWIGFTIPIACVPHLYARGRCDEKTNYTELGQKTSENHTRDVLESIKVNEPSNMSIMKDPPSLYQESEEIVPHGLRKHRRRPRKSLFKSQYVFESFELPFVKGSVKSQAGDIKLEASATDTEGEVGNRKPYDFKSPNGPYVDKRKNPYSDAIFTELFFIVFTGEIFQSATDDLNTHFDGTFLEHLGVLYQNLVNNNIYSAMGIGIVAFVTGLILRFAPKVTICDIEYGEYKIAFVIFSVLMVVAVLISTRFDFSYRRRRRSFEIGESLRKLISISNVTFLLVVVIMGILRGVLFNFVYWNIADIGGSDLVVGMTVVSQYLSDTIMSFSASILMTYFGYVGMIYLGLASYGIRFLIYSWLSTPESAWVAPPVELLQGISHSTAWSAFLLYITNYTPASSFPTGIFLLQGLYLGVGGSIGGFVGGILIQTFDSNVAFRLFGLVSVLTCLVFVMIQPSGGDDILPSQADTIMFLTEEDNYSSYSEDEIFDYSQHGVVYVPSKNTSDGMLQAKKIVLPAYGSPLVPICLSLSRKDRNET